MHDDPPPASFAEKIVFISTVVRMDGVPVIYVPAQTHLIYSTKHNSLTLFRGKVLVYLGYAGKSREFHAWHARMSNLPRARFLPYFTFCLTARARERNFVFRLIPISSARILIAISFDMDLTFFFFFSLNLVARARFPLCSFFFSRRCASKRDRAIGFVAATEYNE